MPKIALLDTYIDRSTSLLDVAASDTLVSMTYHNKSSKKTISSSSDASSYTCVRFKTYNPRSGTCYSFKTSKAKDLSRILSALGPRGVQFTKTKKVSKEPIKLDDHAKTKILEEKYIVNGKGFASLMSNTEFKGEEEEVKVVPEKPEAQNDNSQQEAKTAGNANAESSSKKKKSKKKKGKK
ncbi:signal recognition particle subunit [Saccharomycopsis crataegensis]|uniref:Signal recognition particle subunit n=1 Tax=Saccharomycopsis crataegensis TaxID=43959 RepID=A0AAV5QNY6_9ASCO|nr:signal recognition particle subunit [Saccharomycopsis crataegensis]